MCLTRWVNRMVAVEIESKRKFAKKENGGFTGRLIIMDEGKVLRDLQLYSESGGTKDRNGEGRGRPLLRDDELSFREIDSANR